MEVVLLKDTDFGDKGAVVKVTSGYARNFLIPRGIALEASVGNVKHIEEIKAQRKKKLEKEKQAVEVTAKKINETPEIIIKAKAGENGIMYGSITNAQLAEAIKEATGVEIEKRRIAVKQIREAGLTKVPVKLTFGITAIAKVKVELEIEKKKEGSAQEPKKRKKVKKEEIAAEIEAQERAALTKAEQTEKKEETVEETKAVEKEKKSKTKKTKKTAKKAAAAAE